MMIPSMECAISLFSGVRYDVRLIPLWQRALFVFLSAVLLCFYSREWQIGEELDPKMRHMPRSRNLSAAYCILKKKEEKRKRGKLDYRQ